MNCPSLTPHLFALALLTSATSAVAQTTPTCPSGVPEDCLLPWPASRYLVADPGTATGYRLALPASAMPTNILGSTVDPTPWNRWDGFSAGSSGIVQLPVVVDPQQLNTYRQIPRSLLFRSRTTVWDLTTGRRVAHWAEVEEAPDADPTKTTLYVRPAARLEDNHHYAILVRPLRTVDGAIYWGTEGLGGLTPEAQARVHELEGERFIAVGWDFRTASGASAWGDLLAMRNQAAELAGEKGLGCTVTDVVESSDVDDPLWRRIEGSITVPQFLNAYGVLNRDPTGRPLANGTTELAFTAIIPRSVAEGGAPTRLVYFGHGLLTDRTEILRDFFVEQADRDGMVVVSTDLSGLTAADQNLVGMALFDLNGFEYVFSSLQQSIAGALLVPRTVGEMCAQLPEFQIGGHRLVSKRERYYYGISLGGNLGPVFAALSDDVNRFAMSVGGINYPVMIPRSILWPAPRAAVRVRLPEPDPARPAADHVRSPVGFGRRLRLRPARAAPAAGRRDQAGPLPDWPARRVDPERRLVHRGPDDAASAGGL
jgi:hypothetical protein